jgi:hypothetical protein
MMEMRHTVAIRMAAGVEIGVDADEVSSFQTVIRHRTIGAYRFSLLLCCSLLTAVTREKVSFGAGFISFFSRIVLPRLLHW